MDDLRQGVTPAAHAALDQLENIRDTKPSGLPPQPSHYYHANMAKGMIAQLLRTANDAMACHYAVEAAAHLLRFAEEGDEQLARMGRPSRFSRTPAGQAAGDAGSDPAGNAPVRREPVAPAADYRRGQDANRANKPRDDKQNVDWLRGWDDAEADRNLDLEEW
jgi:hypothetical protein